MRVLIADDDRDLAEVLAEYVTQCGHEVVATVTGGGLATIQAFARLQPDAVVLDIRMPRYNGLTVCRAVHSRKPDTAVIFVSGQFDGDHPFVGGCHAAACLQKPVSLADLRETFDGLAAA